MCFTCNGIYFPNPLPDYLAEILGLESGKYWYDGMSDLWKILYDLGDGKRHLVPRRFRRIFPNMMSNRAISRVINQHKDDADEPHAFNRGIPMHNFSQKDLHETWPGLGIYTGIKRCGPIDEFENPDPDFRYYKPDLVKLC